MFVDLFMMDIPIIAKSYVTVALICISLMASDAEHPFMCPGPSVCPPWRSVCSGPLPIFICIVGLPGVKSCEFFIYFGDQTLLSHITGKYIFPYGLFPFHFADVFLAVQKLFNLMKSHLFTLSFISLALGDISVKILLRGISEIFLLCSPLGLI